MIKLLAEYVDLFLEYKKHKVKKEGWCMDGQDGSVGACHQT